MIPRPPSPSVSSIRATRNRVPSSRQAAVNAQNVAKVATKVPPRKAPQTLAASLATASRKINKKPITAKEDSEQEAKDLKLAERRRTVAAQDKAREAADVGTLCCFSNSDSSNLLYPPVRRARLEEAVNPKRSRTTPDNGLDSDEAPLLLSESPSKRMRKHEPPRAERLEFSELSSDDPVLNDSDHDSPAPTSGMTLQHQFFNN